MKVRTWLAVVFWLGMMALLAAVVWLGLLNGVAGLDGVLSLLTLIAIGTVGALMVQRHPDNVIGWLFCLDVVLNTAGSLANELVRYTLITRPGALAGADWLAWCVAWIGDSGWAILFTFTFLLFPTGRLPSPRWRPLAWFIAALIVFHTLVAMFRPGPFFEWPTLTNPLGRPIAPALITLDDSLNGLVVLIVIASLGSLVLRYRMITASAEKQQIKWIAYVAALLVGVFALDQAANLVGEGTWLVTLTEYLSTLAFAAFPVAVGVSILRYRLWNIDVLIRRTLIYGALTAALALLYAASTVVLQQVFRAVTREDSQLVVVLSTLFIAAGAAPLRRRLQAVIDRRFYRAKVDAARTLAAFGATARDEVDLDRLTQALEDSVGAAFQPAHLTLWLPGGPKPRRVPVSPPTYQR